MLCEQNKTDLKPPQDIQFEEYGKAQTLNRQPQSVEKVKKGKKGGFFSKKVKKVSPFQLCIVCKVLMCAYLITGCCHFCLLRC